MKKSFNIEKHYCYLVALYTLALVVVFMRPQGKNPDFMERDEA
jgi:hypothetical protein